MLLLAPTPLLILGELRSQSITKQDLRATKRPGRKSLVLLRSAPSPQGSLQLQLLKWTRQPLSSASSRSCNHRLDQLLAVALRLLVLRLRGKQQLKPPGWRLKGVKQLVQRLKGLQLQKLLLLPLLLLPAQTALISLEVEDTTLGCRLPISRLSIKPENEDLARTSEDCDILPTTTD